ncbi:universal stress protein [Novipirellula sp. SH528]|uniref:universal stress protein n=1 Tax=Novipirellula sp. SH528 TaxID=3454466 RepID=UPI003F9FA800
MKNIVLAIDGSQSAEVAARFLAHLPHPDKVDLTVVTVLEIPSIDRAYPISDWMLKSLECERAYAHECYANIEKMFEGANVNLRHEIREGDRGVSIVHVARECGADLIVVGARGHSIVGRLLLGSTSEFVATHAHCSVLVVRPRPVDDPDRPLRIAIGYEETASAQAALEEFAETGWGRQTEVDLVAVISFASRVAFQIERDPKSVKQLAAKANQLALEQLHDKVPQAKPHLIESEHVSEGLVTFTENRQSDLLIVGETPRNFLGRALMGNVTRYVVRHAPCSVWITRNRVIRGLGFV